MVRVTTPVPVVVPDVTLNEKRVMPPVRTSDGGRMGMVLQGTVAVLGWVTPNPAPLADNVTVVPPGITLSLASRTQNVIDPAPFTPIE